MDSHMDSSEIVVQKSLLIKIKRIFKERSEEILYETRKTGFRMILGGQFLILLYYLNYWPFNTDIYRRSSIVFDEVHYVLSGLFLCIGSHAVLWLMYYKKQLIKPMAILQSLGQPLNRPTNSKPLSSWFHCFIFVDILTIIDGLTLIICHCLGISVGFHSYPSIVDGVCDVILGLLFFIGTFVVLAYTQPYEVIQNYGEDKDKEDK